MKFEAIDISRVGPFSDNQVIRFVAGMNLIQGPPGSGKTTIFHALEDQYRNAYQRDDLPIDLATKLVFVGENYSHLEARGKRIVQAVLEKDELNGIKLLPTLIAQLLNQLIAPKVKSGLSKFGPTDKSGFPFQVQISPNGDIGIFDFGGDSVTDLFQAAGECFLLALSCNLATRTLLGFTDPIVVDDAFGMLDEFLLSGCHRGIEQNVEQRIYIISESWGMRISATSAIALLCAESGKAQVVAVRA